MDSNEFWKILQKDHRTADFSL